MDRIEATKLRLNEYKTLLVFFHTEKSRLAPNGSVTVYVGDGYFVDMALAKAKRFVQERVNTLQLQLEKLCYAEGLTDEGLPIMDIYEELDENGNVINSQVEHASGSLEKVKQAMEQAHRADQRRKAAINSGQSHSPQSHPQQAQITEITEPPQPTGPTIREVDNEDELMDEGDRSEPVSDIRERKAPEVREPKQLLQKIPVQAPNTQNFHGMSRDDMIELELLDDELEQLHVRMDEDEDYEEDFDRDYEMEFDDEASDGSDEDEFGRSRGSMFPTDPRTAALLEKYAAQKKTRSGSTSGKSVSFSPSLEVREFETSRDERRGDLIDEIPSHLSGSHDEQAEQAEQAMSDIVERTAPVAPASTQPPKAKVSRFKQQRAAGSSSTPPTTSAKDSNRPAMSDIVEKPNSNPPPRRKDPPNVAGTPYSRKYKIPENKPTRSTPMQLPQTQPNPPEELAQFTNDPDEVDLKDLEREALEYFDDATIPDDQFLELHDGYDDDHDDDEPRIKEIHDEQSVSSSIVERMPEHVDMDDQDTDMKEIRNEYQRLRQKLVYKAGGYKKTDADKAVEQVDENGDPVKVSRFRAARLGLR